MMIKMKILLGSEVNTITNRTTVSQKIQVHG